MKWRKLLWVLAIEVACCGAVTAQLAGSGSATLDGPEHDGVEVTVDLPVSQHVKNFGAPLDGKGLCVFASMDMLGRWHHQKRLENVIRKMRSGGGWPEKVDLVIKEMSPETKYIQYEGTDPALLDETMARGGGVCVTYGYGERYGMHTIYHMVLLVHLDGKWACIIDNNFPATYEWMARDEFLKRWRHPDGKGWAFAFLESPPPPIPRSE